MAGILINVCALGAYSSHYHCPLHTFRGRCLSWSPLELAKTVVDIIEEMKGSDILILDIRTISLLADYFVICTSETQRQIEATVDSIVPKAKSLGRDATGRRRSQFRLGADRHWRRSGQCLQPGAAQSLCLREIVARGESRRADPVVRWVRLDIPTPLRLDCSPLPSYCGKEVDNIPFQQDNLRFRHSCCTLVDGIWRHAAWPTRAKTRLWTPL